jgi:hypothetical protein
LELTEELQEPKTKGANMQHKLMRRLPRPLAFALVAGILGCLSPNAAFAATRAVAPPPDSAAHWNARANLCLLQAGENIALVDTAMLYYAKAIKLAPEDAGLKLNLAIAHMAIGDTLGADSLFHQAYVQVGNDIKKLYDLLGLEEEDSEESRGAARNLTADEVKQRMAKCEVKNKPKKKNTKPAGPKRSFPREELQEILYWRQSKE